MEDTKKKRKRTATKKLIVNDKVEVRSVEEGFLGSWHVGVVIECGLQSRRVQYDELLDDDGSQGMVDVVSVSPILDGLVPVDCSTSTHCRGNIRPSPPLIDFQKRSLHFGQCVDVYFQDAWWEGVIFDHQDCCDERRVFFPDLGDEMLVGKDVLRITQEWNEVTEEWKIRGNWSLLELLEEVELNWPLLVSVRQIWYEIQITVGFEKLKDWTNSSKDCWKELLGQVLSTSYNLTLKHILEEISSTGEFAEENQLLEPPGPALDAILKPKVFFHKSQGAVPCQSDFGMDHQAISSEDLTNTNSPPKEKNTPLCLASTMSNSSYLNSVPNPHILQAFYNPVPVTSLRNFDDNSEVGSAANIEIHHSIRKLKKYYYSSKERPRLQWLPAESYMNLKAENCPDSVAQYIISKRGSRNTDARKHLLFLGWKVQYARDKRLTRMRYISPKNEMHYSLYQACLALQCEDQSPACIDKNSRYQACLTLQCEGQSPTYQDNQKNNDDLTVGMISPKLTEETQKRVGLSKWLHVEKQYCPQAVLEYAQLRSIMPTGRLDKLKNLASNGRKHLSAVGWKIYIADKRGKKELRYTSPSGKTFYSLLKACQWYLTEVGCSFTCAPSSKQVTEKTILQLTCTNSASSPGHMESEIFFGDLDKKLPAESSCDDPFSKLAEKGEIQVYGSSKQPKMRKRSLLQRSRASLRSGSQNEGSSLFDSPGSSKKGKDVRAVFSTSVLQQSTAWLQSGPQNECSPGSTDKGKDVRAIFSASVLRERAQEVVVSSSYQVPRTFLSLLIDSNIVVPGTKVHYKNRKRGSRMKEGTVSCEGIKCTCCHEVFTLSKFEAHAGSTLHRPSANIFLDDGRSLFDCQMQLEGEKSVKKRGYRPNQVKARHAKENDSICSICHYGGELLLCDHCPSSFHTNCLGLKDIPHGDWFCTSCCCAICGQGRFDEDNKQPNDDSFLNCSQCEHRHHLGCLRRKDLVKPDYQQEGTWFCSVKCEQIHLGLQNLLGKPIIVGEDNLSWILLKYKKAAVSDRDCFDYEYSMESYRKLNVALSIMHECFEPVKEPRSGRNLVKDVIFSRRIERHQLNFDGFYTAALERNDELISVATIRVYGEKFAEIPLVATRYKYRRLGMCRILMNELEKKLIELGVERLVLPAVSSVLTTWETSFGFSRMSDSERLSFLDCRLLDFPGSVICQKLLKNTPNADVSKAHQEDQVKESEDRVKESEILDQRTTGILRGSTSNVENLSAPSVIVMNEPPEEDLLERESRPSEQVKHTSVIVMNGPPEEENHLLEHENQPSEQVKQMPLTGPFKCQNEISLKFLVESKPPGNARNNIFRFYKRRRLDPCES